MNRLALLRVARQAVSAVPGVVEHLAPETRAALKAAGSLQEANAAYHDSITQALLDYFKGGSVTAPRNSWKRATVMAFADAYTLGFTDGGGELPLDENQNAWLDAQFNIEFGNIDSAFVQAKELRADKESDYFAWVTQRADGYTRSLAGINNAGRMAAMGNKSGVWHLGKTKEHCDTCSRLNGTSHRISWYIAHNYIPRKPGSATDCGGYRCDCSITDKNGNGITI